MTSLLLSTSQELPPSKAATIYSGLCRAALVLFGRPSHRKRLRGRSQQVNGFLQGLLRCLFVTADDTKRGRIEHPRWLDDVRHPLKAKQAAHLTLVLNSLFDPTTWSVTTWTGLQRKRNSQSGPLTDSVRSAKIQAGQMHGPAIVTELCHCLLTGTFCDAKLGVPSGEGGGRQSVRGQLMQGVWPCLAAIPKANSDSDAGGLMDVMGSGMLGSGGRAVLKGLLAEWRRVGGGSR